jgi:hypothetical protein
MSAPEMNFSLAEASARPKVIVPAPKAADATRKMWNHMILIGLGIALTIGLTFVPMPTVVHFGPAVISIPGFVQEIADRIHFW